MVRVRLLESRDVVKLAATSPPTVRTGADRPQSFNIPAAVEISLTPGGWRIGNAKLGTGELVFEPSSEGSLKLEGITYRGRLRMVPVAPGRFDVVNDVDVDGYLMGVVPKEMLARWDLEAYKAQAIVARTYALYEVRTSTGSYWDVFPDERSQVYGGLSAETAKSRIAVEDTRGIVVTALINGRQQIFRSYFSSCCGGVTQSAVDAFGYEEPHIAPLAEQNVKNLCAASPRFNWGPVVVRKDELTRRFRLFGQRRNRPEREMAGILNVQIAPDGVNSSGRPVRFIVTDVRGVKYSFSGEELRTAINTDAPKDNTVYSSFFKIINDDDTLRFVEGHGWGHGVGMCQWCAQSRAEQGMRHEDIVLAAFQRATLVRAY